MKSYVRNIADLYGDIEISPCPFTEAEIEELSASNEMLVYLPKDITAKELCARWGLKANIDFDNELMIRNVMVNEDVWFITAATSAPEMINETAHQARRIYDNEGLHGMDLRRYIAFCASHRYHFSVLPDQQYWCFLLSGSYDRSGISIVGFDRHGILNHHGWMKNFRSKFTGSRYVVLPPRLELRPETISVPRSRRNAGEAASPEASIG